MNVLQNDNRSGQEESRASTGYESEGMTGEGMKDQETNASTTAEVTAEGKYKCRTCGQVFDTLGAHNEHHRKMHEQTSEQIPVKQQAVEKPMSM